MDFGYKDLPIGVLETSLINNEKEIGGIDALKHNLKTLNNIIDYNIKNKIKVFRLSLDFILSFKEILEFNVIVSKEIMLIQNKINSNNIRLIFDLENKINLNSCSKEIVKKSIFEIEYFIEILNLFSKNHKSKILIHNILKPVDKNKVINNFIENYLLLDSKIKDSLIIENNSDYTIEDVLEIASKVNIPVIYNNNLSEGKSDLYWINQANKTWKKTDGNQIIQYTQENNHNNLSKTIYVKEFKDFVDNLDVKVDIILDAKDRNLSTIKCINLIENNNIKFLEDQWSKYKYIILERSPNNYNKIRQLLKDKKSYPVIKFYKIIEESLDMEKNKGYTVNALEHVWGYFKKFATTKEKETYINLLNKYVKGVKDKNDVKYYLKSLAFKYDERYLLNSYYFFIN